MSIIRTLLVAILVSALAGVSAAQQTGGGKQAFKKIELNPPARFEIKPFSDVPAMQGHPVQFEIDISGVPEPVNMWSASIEYTTGTLTFENIRALGQDSRVAIAISDPVSAGPGRESRNISALSIEGWKEGAMALLTFGVPSGAQGDASIILKQHPTVREGIAHDSIEDSSVHEFSRELVYTRTQHMKIAREGEGKAPEMMPQQRTLVGPKP